MSKFQKPRKKGQVALFTNWVGAAALAVAPFLIDYSIGKLLAITGFVLITFDIVKREQWHLVLLNVLGIIGYLWSLIT